ncbi:MAG: type 4a pilus biogenesis protein PilO [Planctomycetes bacterium]|nr:type 4a pilus biogenesis protein PilO [Planctomycetota bacterium]
MRLEEADGRAGALLKEIPIAIKARCGYHRLGDFISKLESAKRVFAVRDIIIAARPQSPRSHDVQLLVSTFLISED